MTLKEFFIYVVGIVNPLDMDHLIKNCTISNE
jgi:hypothetical protein